MKVVWVNGCFDLLHYGHVQFLHEARRQGDWLVVGIPDDDTVCRIKGRGHPFFCAQYRAAMLDALIVVDQVVIYSQSPVEAILKAQPDVIVRGWDQRIDDVPDNMRGHLVMIHHVGDYAERIAAAKDRLFSTGLRAHPLRRR